MAISPQDWATFRAGNASWMTPAQLTQFQQIADNPNSTNYDLQSAMEAAGQGGQAKLNAESLAQYNTDLALYHGMAAHAPLTQDQFDTLKASSDGLPSPGNLSGSEYPGGLGAFRPAQAAEYAKMQADKLANLHTGFGGMLSTLASNPVTGLILSAALGPEMGSLTGLTSAAGAPAFAGASELASGLTGAAIGGGTSALTGGNPLMGALKGGVLAGLGSGISNNFGDITSGLGLTGADTAGQSFGQVSGLSDMFGAPSGATGMNAGGALSGEAPTGQAPTMPDSQFSMGADLQGIANGTASIGGGEEGGLSKFLSGALSKIGKNPLAAAGALAAVANSLQQGKVAGTQDQGAILAQQQARQAQDAAFSKQTIDMLNAASTGRAPVQPNITDYYTYGTRPEATFFSQANPIHY